jgi:hypothetical protein
MLRTVRGIVSLSGFCLRVVPGRLFRGSVPRIPIFALKIQEQFSMPQNHAGVHSGVGAPFDSMLYC